MKYLLDSQAKLYVLCSFVSLGGFMYGYDSGVVTTILVMPPFQEHFFMEQNTSSNFALVPVSLAASTIASFAAGLLADLVGRKRLFLIATFIHMIGCIVEIGGQSQSSFFAGRILTGFGVGIYSMLVPLYQSEIANPQTRGRLIAFYQVLVTLGFCAAFWIGYGTYRLGNDSSWRIPIGLQLVPNIIMLMGIYFIPESPRWLIVQGRNDEAVEILARLRSDGDLHNVEVQMEITSIVQDITFEKMANNRRFMSLLSKGNDNNRKRLLLGIGINCFTQLTGINALLYYLPHILESAGITEIYSALIGNGVGGTVNFLATIIDKWDRRTILIFGALLMAICMVTIAAVSGIFNQQLIEGVPVYGSTDAIMVAISNMGATYSILALLCVFIAFFAMSWGPIAWIYPAEIFPQMIRANAMGVSTSFSYLFNLFISLVSPVMFREIIWGTYLFFGCMCVIMAGVVYTFYPETRGRSLEEIQLIFSGALVDKRPDAHHPATAAEALLQLEQIQHRNNRGHLSRKKVNPLNFTEWDPSSISTPLHFQSALNNNRYQTETLLQDDKELDSLQHLQEKQNEYPAPSSSLEMATKSDSSTRSLQTTRTESSSSLDNTLV
ncbi:hypothetical protein K501DRAFT_285901 [Backusella circina FSU 941]|nr:hypothetical protein K501DRAFT_285901 [Backusella circina FSU 941]